MLSEIIRQAGEIVTVVRLSTDNGEESSVAKDIMCRIKPVDGKYENWQADLAEANSDIQKGDILRRKDGSELQVLRSVTQSYPIGDMTKLDLKDYDRAEQSFQIDVADVLTDNLLPKHLLHRVVSQKVLPIFMQGSYGLAVFEAFK